VFVYVSKTIQRNAMAVVFEFFGMDADRVDDNNSGKAVDVQELRTGLWTIRDTVVTVEK